MKNNGSQSVADEEEISQVVVVAVVISKVLKLALIEITSEGDDD
ncbi:MAG: hypothetical protein QWI73_05755 [Alphaproteobacteria bacterium]|nr:hypothetical protein [Alphaproteobacteria bacterium]